MPSPATTWEHIIHSARSSDFLRFNNHVCAVLQFPKISAAQRNDRANGSEWDRVITAARDAELLRFCADGVAVLLIRETGP